MTKATLDELVKKTTIKFPEPGTAHQVEMLLGYIAETTRHIVDYDVTMRMNKVNCSIEPTLTSVKISGMLKPDYQKVFYDEDVAAAYFRCVTTPENPLLFSSIEFDTIPGYAFDEHNPALREFWNTAQKTAEKFYKSPAGMTFWPQLQSPSSIQ